MKLYEQFLLKKLHMNVQWKINKNILFIIYGSLYFFPELIIV